MSRSGWHRISPKLFGVFELICLYSLVNSASINCLLLHMFPIPGSLGILPPRSTFLGSIIPTPHRRLGASYHGTPHRFDFVRRSRPTVLTISSQSSLRIDRWAPTSTMTCIIVPSLGKKEAIFLDVLCPLHNTPSCKILGSTGRGNKNLSQRVLYHTRETRLHTHATVSAKQWRVDWNCGDGWRLSTFG